MESSIIMNFVIFFISVQLVEVEATQLHDAVIGMFVGISIAFIMLVTAIAISCKIFVCVDRSSQGSVLQSNVQTSLPHTSLMASNSPHSVTSKADGDCDDYNSDNYYECWEQYDRDWQAMLAAIIVGSLLVFAMFVTAVVICVKVFCCFNPSTQGKVIYPYPPQSASNMTGMTNMAYVGSNAGGIMTSQTPQV